MANGHWFISCNKIIYEDSTAAWKPIFVKINPETKPFNPNETTHDKRYDNPCVR